ncbi:MAG TPA: 2-oxoglutarate dehydrogenase E1 component [Bacillota bacterium]|nr:2-oxoglutarate dehydrogenase E1 component [Bacillota bacterium]
MTQNGESTQRFWKNFHGPNIGYIEEQYELFKEDPEKVDPTIRELFQQYGAPQWIDQSDQTYVDIAAPTIDLKKVTSAMKLIDAIRRHGHLEADIYPVGKENSQAKLLKLDTYGLTDADLKEIDAKVLWEDAPVGVDNGYDVVNYLKEVYTGTISYEFDHVNSDEERQWLQENIEARTYTHDLSNEEKTQLLDRLAHVEGFENFLHKTFVGQKRFSIEGLEMLVPILDRIIKYASEDKIKDVMMGMAHRGRLSVLAHVLSKPVDLIFSEFQHSPDKGLVPSESSPGLSSGWTGDVSYHFGGTREVKSDDEVSTRVTMAHNPSHLEYVNPVVAGFTRAAQDNRSNKGYPDQDLNKAFSVLVHGDAAFIGEGIVAETLNLSGIPGYQIGGTIHVIANNLVGYTTDQEEGRSTRYASDLAKGFEIPVIHVNADDPVACVAAITLAYKYRKKFNKDFVIDLVGYRRYGHNEMDEPRATQPLLYKAIDEHPTVVEVYAERLLNDGVIDEQTLPSLQEKVESDLRAIYDSMKEADLPSAETLEMPIELGSDLDEIDTAIPFETLKSLHDGLLERPEGFNQFRRLSRVFKRREKMLDEGQKADWGAAEALAYASIVADGTPIRLTGQDSERGTFAHRHLVLYDEETNEKYCPIHGLEEAKASFDIRNSPLSEAGVLGFEYGYSVYSEDTLVIWEAQFGDFANVAQVIFDQFMSAARAKWGDKSNMVLLLPHGYEGQGPEHSSARLERFLQMAAENNWIVANVTSSAQFFHLLRRQAALGGTDQARPLVVMSPKSLLRNERVASEAKEFTDGKFEPLRQQPNLRVSKKNAKRLLLGSGKVMVDIEAAIDESDESFNWLRALRVEQLYPFPKKQLEHELKQLPNLEEIVWVQEEPKNMGSWNYVSEILREFLQDGQTLRYVGRPERSSPSVGDANIHRVVQEQIVREAINPSKGGNS